MEKLSSTEKILRNNRNSLLSKRCRNIFCHFILVVIFSFSSAAQDYDLIGKEYLAEKTGSPKFLGDFTFSNNYRLKNLYVLESDNPECFVAFLTKRNDFEVFAYSASRKFLNDDRMTTLDSFLIENLNRQKPDNYSMKTGNKTRIPVGPMLQTKWSQERWYNYYCPYNINSNAGEHDLVGCLATAMSQIIRYYGKWNNFVISKTHTFRGKSISSSSAKYNWFLMEDKPGNYDLEVCRLLADVGIQLEMGYGPEFSSKGFGYARKLGFQNIGYDRAYTDWRRQNENWLDDLYANLKAYHPVLIGGGNHAFVCDGYDSEGMLHFNMGWSGYLDGYYSPSCVTSFNYYCDEAVFDAFPTGYLNFISPGSLRTDNIDGQFCIVWSPPESELELLGYNIYYSDQDAIFYTDTILAVDILKPGEHDIMISAQYPDGESLWIGPVRVFVKGEKLAITDKSLEKAIKEKLLSFYDVMEIEEIYEGSLDKITKLEVTEPISFTKQLEYLHKVQSLSINAGEIDQFDFNRIGPLLHLQNLTISNYNGVLPDLSNLPKLVNVELINCEISSLTRLEDVFLMELNLSNCAVANLEGLKNLTNLVHLSIENTAIGTTEFLNSLTQLRKLTINGCGLNSLDLNTTLSKTVCLDLAHNQIVNTDFLAYFPALKALDLSDNGIIHLNDFMNLAYMKSLSLNNNLISDISPLLKINFYCVSSLRLENNPISKESYSEIIPELESGIRSFTYPLDYQPSSPCYPVSEIVRNSSGRMQFMQWDCENDEPERSFDIFIRKGDSIRKIKQDIRGTRAQIDLGEDLADFWFIRANFRDTCFYSGLYDFADKEMTGPASDLLFDEFENIRIYPNPANHYANISGLPQNGEKYELRIINSAGQLVYNEVIDQYTGNYELNVADFRPGMYYYQILSKQMILKKGQLIVSR